MTCLTGATQGGMGNIAVASLHVTVRQCRFSVQTAEFTYVMCGDFFVFRRDFLRVRECVCLWASSQRLWPQILLLL